MMSEIIFDQINIDNIWECVHCRSYVNPDSLWQYTLWQYTLGEHYLKACESCYVTGVKRTSDTPDLFDLREAVEIAEQKLKLVLKVYEDANENFISAEATLEEAQEALEEADYICNGAEEQLQEAEKTLADAIQALKEAEQNHITI